MIKDCNKVLILGCKGCVTVCNVGGSKEVGILASTLKIARNKEGKPLEVVEETLERQCDPEYIQQVKDIVDDYDGVISMACGVGPQFLSGIPEPALFPGREYHLFWRCGGTWYLGREVRGLWDLYHS